MIEYFKGPIRIGELWFDEVSPGQGVDLARWFQYPLPPPKSQWRPFHTILIDLREAGETTFGRFKKDTRNEIRRARDKDAITYHFWQLPSAETISRFARAYAQLAADRHLNRLGPRIAAAARDGCLRISAVQSKAGIPLGWHVYIQASQRVRLLHSVSSFRHLTGSAERNLVGRANRLHHWLDMVQFKDNGVSVYDFGGWYEGYSDSVKLRINRFKEEFGGTVVQEFNAETACSAVGWSALRLLALAGSARAAMHWLSSRALPSRKDALPA